MTFDQRTYQRDRMRRLRADPAYQAREVAYQRGRYLAHHSRAGGPIGEPSQQPQALIDEARIGEFYAGRRYADDPGAAHEPRGMLPRRPETRSLTGCSAARCVER